MEILRPTGPRTFRGIVGFAMIAALAIVAAALPGRWEGGEGSETDRPMPLRPATADEAAVLLTYGDYGARCSPSDTECRPSAVVSALTDDRVTLVTRNWVVRVGPQAMTAPVSWNGYRVEHEVERHHLETALGRALANEEVVAADGRAITYRSAYWWAYAGVETLFLAGLFAAGLAILRLLRPVSLLPLAFALWTAGLAAVVRVFAPATWDGDFFFQRIVIDRLCVASVFLAAYTIPFALAAAAWFLGAALGGRGGGRLPRALGGVAGVAVGLVALYGTSLALGSRQAARLDAVSPCVVPAVRAWSEDHPDPSDEDLRSLGDTLAHAEWGACSGGVDEHEGWPFLYIPTADRFGFFFLGSNAKFIDSRGLENSIGGEQVATLREGAPSAAALAMLSELLFGRFAHVGSGREILGSNGATYGYLVAEGTTPSVVSVSMAFFLAIAAPQCEAQSE